MKKTGRRVRRGRSEYGIVGRPLALTAALTVSLSAGCGSQDAQPEQTAVPGDASPPVSGVQATNAFYYYADVDAAWAFYRDVLGLETVVDYGFAKILRVSPASYLTLVDEQSGMHSADEPKSVTLAVVTEQVEGWYQYLTDSGVAMHSEYVLREGRPHDGFVAVDPEGYFLEFERFNPHEENRDLIPILDRVEPLGPAGGARPPELEIQATVLWIYFDDVPAAQRFYENMFDVPLLVDQGWAKVYRLAETGFLGLVDGSRGLHSATEEKGVTVSFFTDDVDAWFSRARSQDGFELRTPEVTDESERVRVFVGYDPEGYFLEWDTFLDVPDNERLLERIAR